MKNASLLLIIGFSASALAVGCSDTLTCQETLAGAGGTQDTPCLPENSRTSTAAERQCFVKPQICPDLSPIRFCSRTTTSESPVNVLFENRGETALTIRSIKVRGDTRCAFKKAQLAPMVGQTVQAGDSFVLRFFYAAPMAPGEDHALIEIESDAENLPVLRVPVCGKSLGQSIPGEMCLPCQDRATAEYTTCFESTM